MTRQRWCLLIGGLGAALAPGCAHGAYPNATWMPLIWMVLSFAAGYCLAVYQAGPRARKGYNAE